MKQMSGWMAGAMGAYLAAMVNPLWANDSTATLGAGGLVLTKTAAISMDREDLAISAEAIRIQYRFTNKTAQDITTQVAFPMPEMTSDDVYERDSGVQGTLTGYMHFTVTADGQPVRTRFHEQAWVKEKDVTARLKALHIPLSPLDGAAQQAAIRKLPRAEAQKLHQEGLLDSLDQLDTPDGPVYPKWVYKPSYVWEQTFPAGKTVVLRQQYRPIVGQSFYSPGLGDSRNKDACIDSTTLSGIKRLAGPSRDGSAIVRVAEIRYILKTGANWRGPIGTFHITLDKGTPETLLSTCLTQLRKTSPTQFEATYKDFTPKQDLTVLLFRKN